MQLIIQKLTAGDVRAEHPFIESCGTHLFQKDRLISWPGASEYVTALIAKFAGSNPVLAAKSGGETFGLIGFRKRGWDTEHFGYPVASIDYFYVVPGPRGKEAAFLLAGEFNRWAETEKIRFASVKIPQVQEITRALQESGFYWLEAEHTLTLPLAGKELGAKPAGIRPYRESDEKAVVRIAETTPWANRFVIDPNIDSEKGRGVYVKWIRNGIKDPQKRTTVLEVGGEAVGFNLWSTEEINRGGETLVIGDQELVGIDPRRRGEGLGNILYKGTLAEMQEAGARFVKTTVSASNPPALNGQANLGFQFNYLILTFHKVLR